MERAFGEIVAVAGEERSIGIADLNKLLPEDTLSSEDIEALVLALAEEGVELREEAAQFPEVAEDSGSTLTELIAGLPRFSDSKVELLQRLIAARKYALVIYVLVSALKDLRQPLTTEQSSAFTDAAKALKMTNAIEEVGDLLR